MIRATARIDSLVVRPLISTTIARSGTPRDMAYFRATAASLVVSPTPMPPVRINVGARPRFHRDTAWSTRARSTGDGRPTYCAAPSTTIASAFCASSRRPARATSTIEIAQAASTPITIGTVVRR